MIDRLRAQQFAILLLAVSVAALPLPAKAQPYYPTKAVTIITGAGAGSAPDVILRIIADRLTQIWQQQLVILNRPGGGGLIAVQAASTADRDGYTLFMAISSTLTVLPETQSKLPMDLNRDLVPIGLLGVLPMVFAAHPSLGVSTMPELIALAKKRPGQVLYGAGRGTIPHLTGELLSRRAGIELTFIPYPTAARAAQDAITGTLSLFIEAIPALAAPVQSGSLKALAVASKTRLPNYPDWPTVAETLPAIGRFESIGWLVLMAPAGSPDTIIQKVNRDLLKVAEQHDVQQRFETLGAYVRPLAPEETAAFIRSEQDLWRPVVREVLTEQ